MRLFFCLAYIHKSIVEYMWVYRRDNVSSNRRDGREFVMLSDTFLSCDEPRESSKISSLYKYNEDD